ncbi:hypothetical protein [Mycolicibacterium houstonense]|nr:hypothetical protein [Mycolicibacterium houstonense]
MESSALFSHIEQQESKPTLDRSTESASGPVFSDQTASQPRTDLLSPS